ncbi:MAG: hypothetical protein IRY95_02605, partial [Clostridia bacterium]|nr:hypothetical protein [Clostridia bacterium]
MWRRWPIRTWTAYLLLIFLALGLMVERTSGVSGEAVHTSAPATGGQRPAGHASADPWPLRLLRWTLPFLDVPAPDGTRPSTVRRLLAVTAAVGRELPLRLLRLEIPAMAFAEPPEFTEPEHAEEAPRVPLPPAAGSTPEDN